MTSPFAYRLHVKTAILKPDAKEDEVTIVEMETEGYNRQQVVAPICAMTSGKDVLHNLDIVVHSKAKFLLPQGAGPVSLAGKHYVDTFGYK